MEAGRAARRALKGRRHPRQTHTIHGAPLAGADVNRTSGTSRRVSRLAEVPDQPEERENQHQEDKDLEGVPVLEAFASLGFKPGQDPVGTEIDSDAGGQARRV